MAAPPIIERHKHHFHRQSPIKESVRAATTADITIATALNNGDSLDGVTLATGDRVLVKDQGTGSQNGIYVVGASPARDYDVSTDDPAFGYLVLVREGTANAGKLFKNTNTTAPTIDTTALTFEEFGSGGALTVEEVDGTPSVSPVTTIVLPNGTLTDDGGGQVTYTPATPGSTVNIEDEGSAEGAADTIDFVGAGVSVTFAAGKATVTIPGGGGGGGLDWNQLVNESGASFANFTAVTGTWSSNGTEIIQTNNAASFVKAYYNTFLGMGFPTIAEVEVWFHSAGQGGGGLNYASLQLGLNGTSDGAPCIILDRGSGVMRWQLWGVTDIRTVSTTVNADTWYKIRLVADGLRISGFKDGTLLGTTHYAPGNGGADRVALGSYASTVKFRNLKVWTLSTGAPA